MNDLCRAHARSLRCEFASYGDRRVCMCVHARAQTIYNCYICCDWRARGILPPFFFHLFPADVSFRATKSILLFNDSLHTVGRRVIRIEYQPGIATPCLFHLSTKDHACSRHDLLFSNPFSSCSFVRLFPREEKADFFFIQALSRWHYYFFVHTLNVITRRIVAEQKTTTESSHTVRYAVV